MNYKIKVVNKSERYCCAYAKSPPPPQKSNGLPLKWRMDAI